MFNIFIFFSFFEFIGIIFSGRIFVVLKVLGYVELAEYYSEHYRTGHIFHVKSLKTTLTGVRQITLTPTARTFLNFINKQHCLGFQGETAPSRSYVHHVQDELTRRDVAEAMQLSIQLNYLSLLTVFVKSFFGVFPPCSLQFGRSNSYFLRTF